MIILIEKFHDVSFRIKTFPANYIVRNNFGSTPWEQTFEFNGKTSTDDSGITVQPLNPGTVTPISR